MVQKKKSDEQDVLVVRDEKTGEISVVAGLSRDGTPKRAPAKAENTPDILRFDRNSDLMDSFFRNFFRQCKEPSRFGFYRIAADQVENLLGVMKELLKDPEANKGILSAHKVDTSNYEKEARKAAKQGEREKNGDAGTGTSSSDEEVKSQSAVNEATVQSTKAEDGEMVRSGKAENEKTVQGVKAEDGAMGQSVKAESGATAQSNKKENETTVQTNKKENDMEQKPEQTATEQQAQTAPGVKQNLISGNDVNLQELGAKYGIDFNSLISATL